MSAGTRLWGAVDLLLPETNTLHYNWRDSSSEHCRSASWNNLSKLERSSQPLTARRWSWKSCVRCEGSRWGVACQNRFLPSQSWHSWTMLYYATVEVHGQRISPQLSYLYINEFTSSLERKSWQLSGCRRSPKLTEIFLLALLTPIRKNNRISQNIFNISLLLPLSPRGSQQPTVLFTS